MPPHAKLGHIEPVALEIIAETATKLWTFHEVRRVILFGSYAKNTHTQSSDIDIAVFVEDIFYGVELFKKIVLLCNVPHMDVQIQLFSNSELEDPCGIVEEVLEYGIDLP